MKKKTSLLLGSLFILTVITGCKKAEEIKKETNEETQQIIKLSEESIKQIQLETVITELQPVTGELRIPARVITNQNNEALVGSMVPGRVHDVFVNLGDNVKAGQVLMNVEGLEIGEIKAGYLKAKANLDFAEADYKRHKILSEQNVGSKQSFLEAEAEYQKALAEFQAEDKKIHSIGLTDEDVANGTSQSNNDHISGRLAIRSQINGVVVERNVVIGQQIDASTNALKIINTNTVWVDGQIYEKDIPNLSKKTDAVFITTVYPGEKFIGKVIYIGQVVDEQTRTITIRCEFNNLRGKLKPQMFGEIEIPISKDAKAITLPEDAVIKDAGNEYVFIKNNAGGIVHEFKVRKIVAGTNLNNRIEVKDGLKPGENVVIKGSFYLKSEMKKKEFGEEE